MQGPVELVLGGGSLVRDVGEEVREEEGGRELGVRARRESVNTHLP